MNQTIINRLYNYDVLRVDKIKKLVFLFILLKMLYNYYTQNSMYIQFLFTFYTYDIRFICFQEKFKYKFF